MRGSILPPHKIRPTFLPGKRSGLRQHGGQARGARAFRHGLLQREIGVHRAFEMRLVDQHDLGDQLADHRQRQLTDILDRDAFGQRRPADRPAFIVQRVPHRRIKRGFGADDLDLGLHRACGDGIAGNQTAAADRDHQHVEIGSFLQHLERDGALPGDDARIVVGMHQRESAFGQDLLAARLRFRHAFAVEHHLGAVRLGRRHLHERRRHRHDDGRRNLEPRGVIGHRLGVIAGRHGDDAALALGLAERGELHQRAAVLERIGDLQIFVFDVDVGAGERRQPRRRQHGRAQHGALDHATGCFDIRNCDAQSPASVASGHHAASAGGVPDGFASPLREADSFSISKLRSANEGTAMAIDVKPHAYDPATNPELFEGVLARRVVAFVIDFVIIAIPVVLAAMFIFAFGIVTLGLGFALYWLLSPATVVWALVYFGVTLGGPRSATIGMRIVDLEMRTWYGAPAYFVLGAVHAIAFWFTVSFFTPFILLVAFFNERRRLLHDIMLGTVIINNPARAAMRGAPAR